MPDPTPTPVPTEPPAVTDDQNGGYLMVGDRILHRSYTNKERLAEYAAMLNHWQEALPDHTILSMVVPNSYPFYAPEDKITASLNQEDMISRLYDQLHPSIIAVDAYTPISQHTEEYLYFRTDHHWTARGAYRAYEGFCDAMGYTAGDISTWDSGEYSDFIGSFYPQVKHLPQAAIAAANPDRVEYFLPPTGYTATAYKAESLWENGWSIPVVNTNLSDSVTNQYMAFTNGDQALIHITTETDNNKGIVVIKESYGNAFIPYLLEHYEHIYILDYRKFNDAARGAPELRLTDLLEHCEAREIMLISYSYVPNEAKLTQWIGRMMPTDG